MSLLRSEECYSTRPGAETPTGKQPRTCREPVPRRASMSPSGSAAFATRAFFVLSFLPSAWTQAAEPSCSEGICIHEIKDASSVRFEAENTRYFDISLNFTVTDSENVDTLETFRL